MGQRQERLLQLERKLVDLLVLQSSLRLIRLVAHSLVKKRLACVMAMMGLLTAPLRL